MNIFRVISNSQIDGEVGLMDLIYDRDENNEPKYLDLKVYSIINGIVSDLIEVNIVIKLAIANNLIEIFKKSENENKDV
jgi:hypothetical protein